MQKLTGVRTDTGQTAGRTRLYYDPSGMSIYCKVQEPGTEKRLGSISIQRNCWHYIPACPRRGSPGPTMTMGRDSLTNHCSALVYTTFSKFKWSGCCCPTNFTGKPLKRIKKSVLKCLKPCLSALKHLVSKVLTKTALIKAGQNYHFSVPVILLHYSEWKKTE